MGKVQVVEIDALPSHAGETSVESADELARRQAVGIRKDLGSEGYRAGVAGRTLAQQTFGLSQRVHLGRVEEVGARIEGSFVGRGDRFSRAAPRSPAVGPDADGRHLQSR